MKINNILILTILIVILLQMLVFVLAALKSERKIAGLLSIIVAPVFLGWKLIIDTFSIFKIGKGKWIRTDRRRQ